MINRMSLVFMMTAGCLIYQSDDGTVGYAPASCGPGEQSPDGADCHCDSECRTSAADTACWDEATTGVPGGMCAHHCGATKDCEAGSICFLDYCRSPCANTSECETGQVCMGFSAGASEACLDLCDEPTDCESGSCNAYSGSCLVAGQSAEGGGVAAPCHVGTDCKSGACVNGGCVTLCDEDAQRCPDGATCMAGICVIPCGTDADCAELGWPVCSEDDGARFCLPATL